MKRLIAVLPVLYGAYQYESGDVLPEDTGMTETWLKTGAAIWKDGQTAPAAKAIPVTAEPGITGLSTAGNPEDLVGKIPKDPLRDRPKPRRKKTV